MTASRLRQLAGQLLSVGFDGTAAPESLRARIAASEVGGVMLFRPNIADPGQVASLVASLRGAAPPGAPLLVSIDQEGGVVQRVRAPATVWPPMLAVGEAGDVARTTAVGRALGEELAALGVGWDFAPVLDVHTNPANPVIGNRAFGTIPEAVSAQALAFWRGLRGAGLVGCGKHFPGHGDTDLDSHLALPRIGHDRARLSAVELAPFRALGAELPTIMTAHVVFEAIEPKLPATLCRDVIEGVLRRELGYEGVIVSDDLEMRAVRDHWGVADAAVRAIDAGCDLLLVCEHEENVLAARDALVARARKEAAFADRLRVAAARVGKLRASIVPAVIDATRIDAAESSALEAEIASHA